MQAVVFALVAAAFLTVYVTQPVLPILRAEFGVTPAIASRSPLGGDRGNRATRADAARRAGLSL
jgi:hypothetical protein